MNDRPEIRVGGTPDDHPTDPGLVCLECGSPLTYSGRGRRPQYCSSACRHRAWERRRAAADGTVATQVVELPALPTGGYDREGVARWLARDPERIVAVATVMSRTRTLGWTGTVEALGRALDHLRPGRPDRPVTALEKTQEEALTRRREESAADPETVRRYEQLENKYRNQVEITERMRRDNTRLRNALAAEQTAAQATTRADATPDTPPDTPAGTITAAGRSERQDPGRAAAEPASAGWQGELWFTATDPTTLPPALSPAGHKAVEMGGRTFHVPADWPRAKARAWCRAHPERAVD